jgi:hypothetical protein
MIAPPVPDGTLAGYRLVRKIAVGSRADVYLGVGSTGTVALKVFGSSTARESVESELDALGRIESPHLVALLDIANGTGDLPILVLERLAHGSVATLMAEREQLECGEAVTLLAPIATLVAELHDVGVAHGRIGAQSIYLGAGRKPVLLGLGHCSLFAPGGTMAAIDREPAAGEDRDALATLALGILARATTVSGAHRVRDLTRWIETAPRAYEFPRELEERLLACAKPLPIAETTGHDLVSAVPARIMTMSRPIELRAASVSGQDTPVQNSPSSLRTRLPALLLDNPLDRLKERAVGFARGVRPRFWVVAGAIAIALVLTVALLPSGAPASTHSAAPQPVETIAAPTPTPLPDDPVLAAQLLLAARTTCIRDLSILCLDAVDEASSAAFASDATLIQQVEAGGEIPKSVLGSAALSLVERMGDSALLSLPQDAAASTNPVSILLIKGATGWRIRDILSGARSTGSSPTPSSAESSG